MSNESTIDEIKEGASQIGSAIADAASSTAAFVGNVASDAKDAVVATGKKVATGVKKARSRRRARSRRSSPRSRRPRKRPRRRSPLPPSRQEGR